MPTKLFAENQAVNLFLADLVFFWRFLNGFLSLRISHGLFWERRFKLVLIRRLCCLEFSAYFVSSNPCSRPRLLLSANYDFFSRDS